MYSRIYQLLKMVGDPLADFIQAYVPLIHTQQAHLIGAVSLLLAAALGFNHKKLPLRWESLVGVLGVLLFIYGQAEGLVLAPKESMMGDAGRILYVHVPAAWVAMVAFGAAFVGSLTYLVTERASADHVSEASTEVGIVFSILLLVLGAIFGRPTWGVYWTWDPRLTASAVMMLTFVGVLLLRAVIVDVDNRARWSAVATIVASINIPITYMSVKWWRTMHQMQSTKNTLDPDMRAVLWFNTWAFVLLGIWFIATRYRIAARQAADESAPALPEAP